MKNRIIIQKIIAYAEKIKAYTVNTFSRADFETDTKTLDACVLNLIQIGELAAKIDKA